MLAGYGLAPGTWRLEGAPLCGSSNARWIREAAGRRRARPWPSSDVVVDVAIGGLEVAVVSVVVAIMPVVVLGSRAGLGAGLPSAGALSPSPNGKGGSIILRL